MATIYCRYIKTNGRRCCSFALRGQALCYFHEKANAHLRALRPTPADEAIIHSTQLDRDKFQREPITAQHFGLQAGPLTLDFPPTLEDAESIQTALSMLITALGQNRIDAKRAGPILYGLQVASQNVDRLDNMRQTKIVVQTTTDESGNEISLDVDPLEIAESEAILAALSLDDDDEDESEYPGHEPDEDEEDPAEVMPTKETASSASQAPN